MPFHDLIRRRAEVTGPSGARYICSAPSLATVYRFVQLYHAEIEQAVASFGGQPKPSQELAVGTVWSLLAASPDRAAVVLATCCGTAAVAQEDVSTCAMAVLRLMDVVRVGAVLVDDARRAPPRDPHVVDDGQAGHPASLSVHVAREFGIDPLIVANEWPFEALLTVQETMTKSVQPPVPTIRAHPGMSFAGLGVTAPPTNKPLPE